MFVCQIFIPLISKLLEDDYESNITSEEFNPNTTFSSINIDKGDYKGIINAIAYITLFNAIVFHVLLSMEKSKKKSTEKSMKNPI